MLAALLAGLMLLSLASCGKTATEDIRINAPSEKRRITETTADTKTETILPADTELKTETTAEKEKTENAVNSESGAAAETQKPAEGTKKVETSPPTQASKQTETQPPKQTEAPKATEPPKVTEPPETKPTEPPTKPTEPQPTEPPATEQLKGFTEADHTRIVSAVKAYAESYNSKGFTFEWAEELAFGWDVGWMGTPRISRDGVDGVISTLKHHVDLIYKTGTDPANGVTANSVRYKVVQLEIDGGIVYAVIYG